MSMTRSSEFLDSLPKLMSGPFWGELRIFLAVAKTSSFSQAAVMLNCSQPTVGRSIKRLEDVLGAQLVIVSAKGVILTERGVLLSAALSRLDYELFELSTAIRAEKTELRGTVRISCPEGLCGFFLAPHLPLFSKLYPQIKVELLSKRNISAIRSNECDIIITLSPFSHSDLMILQGGVINFIPMASNFYIKKFGIPNASNIKNHRFIDSPAYQIGLTEAWLPWRRLVDACEITHTCENSFPYGLMVRSGLGIGLLANYAMSEPTLVPLDLDVTIRVPIYIAAAKERIKARPVQIAFEWLSETLGPANPWLSETSNPQLQPGGHLKETLAMLLPDAFLERN